MILFYPGTYNQNYHLFGATKTSISTAPSNSSIPKRMNLQQIYARDIERHINAAVVVGDREKM